MINGNRISLALNSRNERIEASQWGFGPDYRTTSAKAPRFYKLRATLREFLKRNLGV